MAHEFRLVHTSEVDAHLVECSSAATLRAGRWYECLSMRFPLLISALALLLSACSDITDMAAIEEEIRTGIQQQSGVTATIDCPSEIEWRVGGTFNCLVINGAQRSIATVSMQNAKGEYIWEVR